MVWIIKGLKKNTRTFKLEVVRLTMLPSFAVPNPNVKFLEPGTLNEFDGEVP
ncbi:hypothetical protein AURDEDRAFT_178696 [Auricularia subglabra TFB-10046 SS5]|uniref:Uncharacterized protein n=1 Tax=Auricularia subglabra (strain TFB-10046 / SS5) TaxID=717982 RepID=J0CPX7_AURST|nr:hypothetical protein AURDEDRAFT_178696 [Auricularia subglabra TFB-10046 SS5]